jgi:hypothetical protein
MHMMSLLTERVKGFRWRIVIVILLGLVLNGTRLVADSAGSQAQTRDERWRQDLQFLATELPRLHANLFFQRPREEFERDVAELNAAIPSLQDHEVIAAMTKIVASMGDGHTRLDWQRTAPSFRTYPLQLYWFPDGLYVTATTEPYRRALMTRLVQIGDTKIEDAFTAVSAFIAHENDQWLLARSPEYLVVPEILSVLKIVANMESARFVFEDAEGNRFALDCAPVFRFGFIPWIQAPDPLTVSTPLYRRNSDLFYWFVYLAESNTIYLRHNAFIERPDLPSTVFSQMLESAVNSNQSERFVVDMRNNGGGNTNVLFNMISFLQFHPDLIRRGALFVIIDRGSFSASVDAAVIIKDNSGALFVGEPTGGKPNSYGEVRNFFLPLSGLRVQYSTRFFQLIEGSDPPSFHPDLLVQPSARDYFAGRDPVLEAVLAYP